MIYLSQGPCAWYQRFLSPKCLAFQVWFDAGLDERILTWKEYRGSEWNALIQEAFDGCCRGDCLDFELATQAITAINTVQPLAAEKLSGRFQNHLDKYVRKQDVALIEAQMPTVSRRTIVWALGKHKNDFTAAMTWLYQDTTNISVYEPRSLESKFR